MNENILLQNEKNRFLADEFFMLSWEAAVQHNKVWNSLKTKNEQRIFRQKIKNRLEKMMLNYADKIIDSITHIKNIQLIQDFSKAEGEKLDIGKCQKLLNMMCKYYWCAGWICEPPHLPVDSINLESLESDKTEYENLKSTLGITGKNKIKWTNDISKIKKYEFIINAFSNFAKSQGYDSVAVWELCNWKRKSNKE